MDVEKFLGYLNHFNIGFFTGVPDSQLAPLCDYLIETYGISDQHIIGVNEGNCVALAAGYYLSTGKVPVVYMQNSGIGNVINPVASLLNDKVYGIPCIFVVGWRGEPDRKDEPQHIFQGEVTISLLENMDLFPIVLSKETDEETLNQYKAKITERLQHGKSVTFVVRKGALESDLRAKYQNHYKMNREEIIRHIVEHTQEDIVISTTGKASRELFEIREKKNQSHQYDFLTVGSMGHCSSIALSIAKVKQNKKIWCIDGDGAVLMHMGAMAMIGANMPKNMVHIVINNSAHETVGGMPTVAKDIDFVKIALGCGYQRAISVDTYEKLDQVLEEAKKSNVLMFLEVRASLGARADLGRPTTTAKENKESFMAFVDM